MKLFEEGVALSRESRSNWKRPKAAWKSFEEGVASLPPSLSIRAGARVVTRFIYSLGAHSCAMKLLLLRRDSLASMPFERLMPAAAAHLLPFTPLCAKSSSLAASAFASFASKPTHLCRRCRARTSSLQRHGIIHAYP